MEKKLFALTFDDGPNVTTMVEVLDILEKYGLKATFFLVGNKITSDSEKTVKRALEMGCEMANHGWTHSRMGTFSEEEIKQEISDTQKKISEIAGYLPRWFRPPYLSLSETLYKSVGLPFILGYSTGDSNKEVGVEKRIENLLSKANHGKIAVMHCFDGNEMTVKALKVAIPELVGQGYEFVTVSELFDHYGYEPEANNAVMYNGIEDFK